MCKRFEQPARVLLESPEIRDRHFPLARYYREARLSERLRLGRVWVHSYEGQNDANRIHISRYRGAAPETYFVEKLYELHCRRAWYEGLALIPTVICRNASSTPCHLHQEDANLGTLVRKKTRHLFALFGLRHHHHEYDGAGGRGEALPGNDDAKVAENALSNARKRSAAPWCLFAALSS